MWFEIVLFLLLQPGLLLTLPPVGKQVFMSGKTSITAIAVHALVFAAILYFKSSIPVLRDFEGFRPSKSSEAMFESETLKLAELLRDVNLQMGKIGNAASGLPPNMPKNAPITELYRKLADKYLTVLKAIRGGNPSMMMEPESKNVIRFLMKLANAIDRVIKGGKNISDEEIRELVNTPFQERAAPVEQDVLIKHDAGVNRNPTVIGQTVRGLP